jgi:hypothetical protein
VLVDSYAGKLLLPIRERPSDVRAVLLGNLGNCQFPAGNLKLPMGDFPQFADWHQKEAVPGKIFPFCTRGAEVIEIRQLAAP